jgi:1,4-dihydroxy-2-naphthoate octaprenyltransferase
VYAVQNLAAITSLQVLTFALGIWLNF